MGWLVRSKQIGAEEMRLSIKQLEALSKVFIDFGKIIFAALVVGNFLPKNIVLINYTLIGIGLSISAMGRGKK